MTWFRVDDQFTRHEKYHLATVPGRALWYAAGVECAAADGDGRVPAHMLKLWAAVAEVPVRASLALCKSGLWHDHKTMCARCEDRHGLLTPGDFRFHDWLDWQLEKRGKGDELYRMRELRKKQLHRRPELKRAIRERDRDLCRYCGILTSWPGQFGDHKSDHCGQFDHVDPWDPENALDKIHISCKKCNRRKGERTPELAGMIVLAPGTSIQPIHAVGSGYGLDGLETDPDRALVGPSDRDGLDAGWVPGLDNPARNGSTAGVSGGSGNGQGSAG